ncbi:hypothetical protein GCK72_007264 [Caenorhabditis remanei]|uniref:F-box associated domain-containing protein n=1 Tax=Caenorhabditis remanei TaxID=31234 RepID=A0A6A5HIM0_CAERE|nr:hypothetical protein GCK72_007264 [Caenorhabditis remanei]KAF1767305.1 hypothetical protein GCK72_007264 [Caenorhabditis remanei]
MSKPLSYQSTRCVLQYFDSTERFLLTSHCPAIKQFEKSIPLRLKSLEFKKDSITWNGLRFCLNETVSVQIGVKRARRGEVRPRRAGEISRTCSYSVTITKRDTRMMSGQRTIARCTKRIKISENKALEKLACILLGERNIIYTKRVEVEDEYPADIEWPANFKVAVDTLVAEHHNFEYILPIVSDSSTLKYLDSQFSKVETFDNDLVKRVGALSITNINESCYPKLATLRNNTVDIVNSSLPKEVIISIVKNWKEEGREIETFFCTKYEEDEEDEEDILDTLNNRLEGRNGTKSSNEGVDRLDVSMSTSSTIVVQKDHSRSFTLEAVHK